MAALWVTLLRSRTPEGRRLIKLLAAPGTGLPVLEGRTIRLRFRPALSAYRGKLISGGRLGVEVHAGAFLRKREIVLDRDLLERPSELSRILVHEIFHFVWVRLGNARRRSFERLLAGELERRVQGELGWSAALHKAKLRAADFRNRSRRWREYVCESFCDTAAWRFGSVRRHAEFTLDRVSRLRRRRWLRDSGLEKRVRV